MSPETKRYDIGLSFAGEDREKVEKVLLELSKRNVIAFYDRAETSTLWGEHAGEILGRIYTTQCRFFIEPAQVETRLHVIGRGDGAVTIAERILKTPPSFAPGRYTPSRFNVSSMSGSERL